MGVGGAGKTCVLESLKTRFSPMPGLAPAQIVPTVGLNLARLEVPAARGGAETCVFWDLGGAPGLRGIWERYYAECDGVLFVVDAALSAENTAAENTDDGEDDRSKDAVTDEQLDEQMALLRRVLAEPRLAGAPALVLVNKADAVSTARAERMARACASARWWSLLVAGNTYACAGRKPKSAPCTAAAGQSSSSRIAQSSLALHSA